MGIHHATEPCFYSASQSSHGSAAGSAASGAAGASGAGCSRVEWAGTAGGIGTHMPGCTWGRARELCVNGRRQGHGRSPAPARAAQQHAARAARLTGAKGWPEGELGSVLPTDGSGCGPPLEPGTV